LNIGSPVKSRIGERHCLFRKKGFDTGGVKHSKLFEKLATSSWNLAAGVETPESGQRSEPIGLFTNPSILGFICNLVVVIWNFLSIQSFDIHRFSHLL
jgi:hypothetical protein